MTAAATGPRGGPHPLADVGASLAARHPRRYAPPSLANTARRAVRRLVPHPPRPWAGKQHLKSPTAPALPDACPQTIPSHVPPVEAGRSGPTALAFAPGADLGVLVAQADNGDAGATDRLFHTLYRQLHRLANREAARLGPYAAIGATTLLHEAYLDMSQRDALAFPTEGHFMAYAARAMRGLVISRVRERQAQKRGGGLDITSLDTEHAESCPQPELLSDIGDCLDELARLEPALAQVVDLKFFCGFSVLEIAALLGSSERSVQRQWEKARLLLHSAMQAR